MEKILPISQDKDILMNFPFVTEKLQPWFYENYVNMLIYGDSGYSVAFADSIGFFNVLMKQIMSTTYTYRYEQIESERYLMELLRGHFDDGFYCFVWVDEYYIPDSTWYNEWHFVHPMFAHGYDLETGEIHTIQINANHGLILRKVKIGDLYKGIRETIKSYAIGDPYKWSQTETVKCFKSEYGNPQPYSLDRFMANLEDYMLSRPNVMRGDFLHMNVPNPGSSYHGLQIYDILADVVQSLPYNYDAIAYPSFHIFMQGKKNIIDRLRYICGLYDIGGGFDALIGEYENRAYKKLVKMAALNLKYNLTEKQMSNSFNTNPEFLGKLVAALREAKEAEKETLAEIYRQLDGYRRESFYKANHYGEEYGSFTYEYPDRRSVKVILGEPQYITDIKILAPDHRPLAGSFAFSNGKKFYGGGRDVSVTGMIHDIYAGRAGWFTYTDENADGDASELRFRMMVNYGNTYWDFTGADRHINRKWQANKEMLAGGGGYTVTGKDPNLSCSGMYVDLSKSKYAHIKYSATCQSENAQVFFTSYDSPVLSEGQSKVFTISPNDKPFEYIVDMSDNGKWGGVSKQLRFDPVSYDNTSKEGECTIEYIEISDRLPVYGSKKDYMKTQGVNGWSYHTYNNGITYREMAWDGEAGVWAAVNDNETIITPTTQTSRNHMGTVRRWTCPAEGRYRVKYSFGQTADNRPDRDRLSSVTLRRNHRVMEKDTYDGYTGTLVGSREAELTLERGEVLNFEFYNGSEHTTETLEISIVIEKL